MPAWIRSAKTPHTPHAIDGGLSVQLSAESPTFKPEQDLSAAENVARHLVYAGGAIIIPLLRQRGLREHAITSLLEAGNDHQLPIFNTPLESDPEPTSPEEVENLLTNGAHLLKLARGVGSFTSQIASRPISLDSDAFSLSASATLHPWHRVCIGRVEEDRRVVEIGLLLGQTHRYVNTSATTTSRIRTYVKSHQPNISGHTDITVATSEAYRAPRTDVDIHHAAIHHISNEQDEPTRDIIGSNLGHIAGALIAASRAKL